MRRPLRTVVIFFVVCVLSTRAAIKQAATLTDTNFEAKTRCFERNPAGDWFVLFYMPWCGYCKEVLPVWDRVADELDGELNVGKVDLEVNAKVMHRFRKKVKGYPTMILFRNGVQYTYLGSRDINELKGFARGGWNEVPKEARSSIPKPAEQMTWSETVTEAFQDFLEGIVAGYSQIWRDYRTELLCAVSTAFSLGAIFGFLLKIFIDACLPPLPPPAARATGSTARPGPPGRPKQS